MTTARFTLRLDPDLKQWLEDEAERRDRSAGWVAKEAIEPMRRASEMRQRMIADAVREADEGVFVSREAVHSWMATWDTEDEASVPQADTFLKRD